MLRFSGLLSGPTARPKLFGSFTELQNPESYRCGMLWENQADFARQDESSDNGFYSQPRICTHTDDAFLNDELGHCFAGFHDRCTQQS